MTMKRTMLILIGLGALLMPSLAQAQYWPSKVGGVAAEESLTAQEREMLAWAREFRDKCSAILEKWIASNEISEDRLFAYLYYPIPRTDPPKFNTDWDRLSDRDVQAIEEAVISKSSTISFAVLVDKFGYLPTHNLRYSQPLTGNTATDLVNNRTKRIFNDRTGLSAARNEASFLIQQYQRDTGEVMFDISVPILVKGKRWGAVRIGYRPVDVR
jgi:methyl-accepting chemotaxis protein